MLQLLETYRASERRGLSWFFVHGVLVSTQCYDHDRPLWTVSGPALQPCRPGEPVAPRP